MKKVFSREFFGQELSVEVGELAQLANGSVFVSYGDTQVLVTATMSKDAVSGIDYFPLSVNYEEKMYAVGKIPGGFLRREGRASEKATLSARLIDRPLRPLFDKGFRNDVQVIITVVSVAYDALPEFAGLFGASLAVCISDIPFDGPAAGVHIGMIDGEIVINPNSEQREASSLDLVVAGTEEGVLMVEAGANEVVEKTMIDAILQAHEAIKGLVEFQKDIIAEIGKEKKDLKYYRPSEEVENAMYDEAYDRLKGCFGFPDKARRDELIDEAQDEILQKYLEEFPDSKQDIKELIDKAMKAIVRDMIVFEKKRPDGRDIDEIRPITCEAGKLARVHGSGLFTRGQTQILTAVTLGALRDSQIIDNLTEEESKRYMHQYNFPPYSTGETGPIRGPGRREIGHGALAERALDPVIPEIDDFPYTIRVVSEALSSNGSTSMGSVCGSTLALMDAGVPIKAAVAGIAMGLIKEETDFTVLTDIQGVEDFYGDMDFKVAGTSRGITAIQMDIKIHGIDEAILTQALNQAYSGRMFILKKMLDEIPEPREDLKEFAPRIITMEIPVDKIREVIGTGGKVINKIIEETGVKIDIMEDGKVYIGSPNLGQADAAREIILGIIREIEVGDTFTGKVTRIMTFGAFVELANGKEGLVHISKFPRRLKKVEDAVKVGDLCEVRVTKNEDGKIDLVCTKIIKQ